jgi:hypothetical protein
MKGHATETGNRDDILNLSTLRVENSRFRDTAGRSQGNAHMGFLPAFRDRTTGMIYRSRFGNGRVAPFHLLDGLPNRLVVKRSRQGRVVAVKSSVISGFLRAGLFYTREQAMIVAAHKYEDA